jgi:hypothetical protein
VLRSGASCERAVRPPPGGGVQGAAGWVTKLIILTDNIQLCLVKWPDDGRLAETCGRNKIESCLTEINKTFYFILAKLII